MERMWINQPSSLQPYHKYHGTNVLANAKTSKYCTAYFLQGDEISIWIESSALSNG